MLFESYMHRHSIFATLTYADEELPDNETLDKRDAQLFLKRLRNRLVREDDPRTFRYFLAGEYGDRFGRPHYHAILFGLSLLDAEVVQAAWEKGYTSVSEATAGRMAYTAKYLQKKLINGREAKYEDGRCNEFALMSRNKGLGSAFIETMAQSLKSQADNPDVSLAGLARVDGRKYPLDRYGRNLLLTSLVDLGVPREDAERLVKRKDREGHPEDGTTGESRAQSKMDRQNRYQRNNRGREEIKRTRSDRVH